MKRLYPAEILLSAEHDASVSLPDLVLAYADAAIAGGAGDIVGYSASDLGVAAGGKQAGDLAAFRKALPKAGKKPHFAAFVTSKQLTLKIVRGDDAHEVMLRYPSEATPIEAWIETMVNVGRAAIDLAGFDFAKVFRKPGVVTRFVPEPPLARTNHMVTVTDAEVDDAYEDPDVFWKIWDKIEKVGKQRVCTRHLDALDEHTWLGRTFESTMLLARAAKPELTEYNRAPYWDERFAAWWEFGDLNDEKAGFPALAWVGYDDDTRTLEYTGFISKTPLSKGGPEPRRVLIPELYDIWTLVLNKKDDKGRPIAAIHVVWPERWMAMRERRPLIDCGAKVFYMDGKKRVEVR